MKPLQRGFTLIEVMVALAVIAIALGALILATGHATDHALYLQQRTLATWIAADRLDELRLRHLVPDTGSRDEGTRELAGMTWTWHQSAQASADPGFVRVRVEVAPAGAANDTPLGYLEALLARPRSTR
ncbi:MAG: type II secretion system protein GspI [Gammaproteobacteria bacterium]|nr:MAG: type II secretion system protein GspI [Gammaproteobacteria bacterium]